MPGQAGHDWETVILNPHIVILNEEKVH